MSSSFPRLPLQAIRSGHFHRATECAKKQRGRYPLVWDNGLGHLELDFAPWPLSAPNQQANPPYNNEDYNQMSAQAGSGRVHKERTNEILWLNWQETPRSLFHMHVHLEHLSNTIRLTNWSNK
jgi:hypothetical protein